MPEGWELGVRALGAIGRKGVVVDAGSGLTGGTLSPHGRGRARLRVLALLTAAALVLMGMFAGVVATSALVVALNGVLARVHTRATVTR